jgi:CheY-like chemotaxis protein
MAQSGQTETSARPRGMSVLPPGTDIVRASRHVSNVPTGDSCRKFGLARRNLCSLCNLTGSGRSRGVFALSQNVPVILVIEDDDAIQTVVEDALSEAGFEPAIAASGEEAATLLKGVRGTYRALVTDIGLRGRIDGWEVARQAREIDPGFPIVYVSGASAADWASKGVPNSIMLTKPFAPAQLVAAVANLLNSGTPTT